MKAKRTVYLVVDYGGEWEDKWDSPYMAFDNEHDAEVFAREVIIIGGSQEYEIRHRDEDTAYRHDCPMVVGMYPNEGELIAAWNGSK